MGRLSWIIQVALKCIYMHPYKRKSEGDVTQKKRRMWPQSQRSEVRGHKPRRASCPRKLVRQETGSVIELPNRVQPYWHLDFSPVTLDFRLPASRTMPEYISVVLSHKLYGNLLQQLQETNIDFGT